jgi:cysteinyl-tRNA synthetase
MRGQRPAGSDFGPAYAFVVLGVAVAIAAGGCGSAPDTEPDAEADIACVRGARFSKLKSATTWAYQIQALERAGRRQALEDCDYDLFVLEPTRTVKGSQGFNAAGMVSRLKWKDGRRRLVLAYVDIGEAERYRIYWKSWWQRPTQSCPGRPNFMLAPDPDGWAGCYPVAYWDARWQRIIATGADSILAMLLDDGFDGIYMDWVEGYDDDRVIERARRDGVNPAREMIRFIRRIRRRAQERDPDFLVIAQNAPDLIVGHPTYPNVIDAIAQEDVHFSGEADVPWGDPRAGDIRTPRGGEGGRQWIKQRLDMYAAAGLPVFTVDYCLKQANRLESYRLSRRHGYVPFVSQTPLDRLPAPPPG